MDAIAKNLNPKNHKARKRNSVLLRFLIRGSTSFTGTPTMLVSPERTATTRQVPSPKTATGKPNLSRVRLQTGALKFFLI